MSEVTGYEVAAELKRKTLETLEWLTIRVQSTQITEEQFSVGIDAVFMAVSGLIPEGPGASAVTASLEKNFGPGQKSVSPKFIDIITACQEEIQHSYPVVKRVLFNHTQGMFKMFRWQAGDAYVDCTTMVVGSTPTVNRIAYQDASRARDALDKVADPGALAKFGYVEVGK